MQTSLFLRKVFSEYWKNKCNKAKAWLDLEKRCKGLKRRFLHLQLKQK